MVGARKMKQASRNKKSQLLQNYLRTRLLKTFRHLKPRDIRTARVGEAGSDLKMTTTAKRLIPYCFECKNAERFSLLYNNFAQAKRYGSDTLEPVLVIKMRKRQPLVIIEAEHFFKLIKL